jgi:hypothetical protein
LASYIAEPIGHKKGRAMEALPEESLSDLKDNLRFQAPLPAQ